MKYPELFITIIDNITIPENGVIYIPHINSVMIDALPYTLLNRLNYDNIRDLNKAVIGFSVCDKSTISTGLWGSGDFGNSYICKFIQQYIAAKLTKKNLYYSLFRSEDEKKEKLKKVYNYCKNNDVYFLISMLKNTPHYKFFV